MNYYVIKNLDTDEVLFLYTAQKELHGGRRLHPEKITRAQYETYAVFGIPVRPPWRGERSVS